MSLYNRAFSLFLSFQYGLYSAFMGGLIYCIFGTSKDVTMGPTAIMSLLVAEFASERAPIHDGQAAAAYAVLLTFICGLVQVAMGFLNLGMIGVIILYFCDFTHFRNQLIESLQRIIHLI